MEKHFEVSDAYLIQAKKLIPGAAQTYSKSYKYWCEGAGPAFLDHGQDGHVWDVDGNEFVDFLCGLGAVTVGYNIKQINEAVVAQLNKGISFTQSNVLEIRLAQKLTEIIPCAQMVKFVKNGSDATTAAIRLARAFTGKEMIACCGYHGYHDWFIGTTNNDLGVPEAVKKLTQTFEYNSIKSLEKIFRENKGQVAAVILEPCQKEGPTNDFLENVKYLAHENKAVLIFDEVVSGFRMGFGGAQEFYGIAPDLGAFGKGMGNGLSISAVVGRADIMKLIEKGAFISTTFGGETLSLAGALAVIAIFEKKGAFEHIYQISQTWMDQVQKLVSQQNLNNLVSLYGVPPHCGLVFKGSGDLKANDLLSVYQQSLIDQGILSVGVNVFCLTHTFEDIHRFVSAADSALKNVKQAINQNSTDGLLAGAKFRPVFERR